MTSVHRLAFRGLVLGAVAGVSAAPASAQTMAIGMNGYDVTGPLLTIGEDVGGYTPAGVLDGLGAYRLDDDTVRVFANHELLNGAGYAYDVNDGNGGTYSLTGSRISYFDVDVATRTIVSCGLAFDTIRDANGDVASDAGFLPNDFAGFSRFCSSGLYEAHQFGDGRGLEDRMYLTGEEDGGFFNPVGGGIWALDPATHTLWHAPALGRGAWENVTVLDSGSPNTVAVLLADDQSPYDFDGDGTAEAAPLYLYVGTKDPGGDFLARNGLRGGTLHVWVAQQGALAPSDFNGSGTILGNWVAIDNAAGGTPSEDGSTGFDEWGYPTQGNLWIQAEALGAFGFSRPEDVATNPTDGGEAVLASTGVDTYDGGVDTFGTLYLVDTNFSSMKAFLTILYDGDADPTRALRSPDNLDWADDGFIYVQEDKAEDDTLDGEPLFGPGAANPNEAGIVRVSPIDGSVLRVANVDRGVVLDASIATATDAVDNDADETGAWETSGILDVSTLFDAPAGTLFLFDVQAHGIDDQADHNPDSRITDGDLVEGGQLLVLEKAATCPGDANGDGVVNVTDLLAVVLHWGACNGCLGDVNGDGFVNVADLLAVVLNFGSCN